MALTADQEIINGLKLFGSRTYAGSEALARQKVADFAAETQSLPEKKRAKKQETFLKAYVPYITEKSTLTAQGNHFSAYLQLMQPLNPLAFPEVMDALFAKAEEAYRADHGAQGLGVMLDDLWAAFPDAVNASVYGLIGRNLQAKKHVLETISEKFVEAPEELQAIRNAIFQGMSRCVRTPEAAVELLKTCQAESPVPPLELGPVFELAIRKSYETPEEIQEAAALLEVMEASSSIHHKTALKAQVFDGLFDAARKDIGAAQVLIELRQRYGTGDQKECPTELADHIDKNMARFAGRGAETTEADLATFFRLARLHRSENFPTYLKTILKGQVNGKPVPEVLMTSELLHLTASANDILATYLPEAKGDAELAHLGLQMALGGDEAKRETLLDAVPTLPAVMQQMRSQEAFRQHKDSIATQLASPEAMQSYTRALLGMCQAHLVASSVDAQHLEIDSDGKICVSPVFRDLVQRGGADYTPPETLHDGSLVTARQTRDMVEAFARTVVLPALLNETPPPYQSRLAGAIPEENLNEVVEALMCPIVETMIAGIPRQDAETGEAVTLQTLLKDVRLYREKKAEIEQAIGIELAEGEQPSLFLNKHGVSEMQEIALQDGWKVYALKKQYSDLSSIPLEEGSDDHSPCMHYALLDSANRCHCVLELAIDNVAGQGFRENVHAAKAATMVYQEGSQRLMEKAMAKTYGSAYSQEQLRQLGNQLYRMIRQGEVQVNFDARQKAAQPRLRGENPLFAQSGLSQPVSQDWQRNFEAWDWSASLKQEAGTLSKAIRESGILPVESFTRNAGLYQVAMEAAQTVSPQLPFRSNRPEWLEEVSGLYRPKLFGGTFKGEKRKDFLETTTALHTMGVDTLSGVSELQGNEIDVTDLLKSRSTAQDAEIREVLEDNGGWRQKIHEQRQRKQQEHSRS